MTRPLATGLGVTRPLEWLGDGLCRDARADSPPIIDAEEDAEVSGVRGTWLPPVRAGGVAAVTAAAVRPDGGVEAE